MKNNILILFTTMTFVISPIAQRIPFEIVGLIQGKVFVLHSSFADEECVTQLLKDDMILVPTGYTLTQKCSGNVYNKPEGGILWFFHPVCHCVSDYVPMFENDVPSSVMYRVLYVRNLNVSFVQDNVVFSFNKSIPQIARSSRTIMRTIGGVQTAYHYF